MFDPAEAVVSRIALRAAGETNIRGFLREALGGALALCRAGAGAARLSPGFAGLPLEEGEAEEFLVTLPPGESEPLRILSLFKARHEGKEPALEGAILSSIALDSIGERPGQILELPLTSATERKGVLLLFSPRDRDGFEPEDLLRGRDLVRALEPLLANVLRVRELEEMIVRDDVADCYNRRYLEEYLAQETARSRRFRTPVSLIFLDMDDLKAVNSAHGHAMGSDALREVAKRVATTTRRIDKLFRYGGDEFCIVLPETDLEGAKEVAERVRTAIASRPFIDREIPGGVTLTASLGLATFPIHASTGEGMITAADAAMRRIKDLGKNAVSVAMPPRGEDTEGSQ